MLKKLIIPAIVVIVILLGGIAYLFLRTPEEASAPIEAIPVVVGEPTLAPTEPVGEQAIEKPTLAPAPTEDVVQPTDAAEEAATADAVSEDAPPTEPATETEVEAAPASEPTIFEIVQAESEIRFLIDEVLKGSPFTVVGVTDQVAGQFAVNVGDLSTTHMGPILVNARTLVTDNNFRNRALKNRILLTDQFEFITFTPTEISGLSGAGQAGENYTFQIHGDLTIRETTQPVTFEATVTADSENKLHGSATATVLYADFGLTIPSVPAVASVEDEVILEIDFVAVAQGEPEGSAPAQSDRSLEVAAKTK